MKILHITATHLAPNGGIPVVLNNLAKEQSKLPGITVRVVSLSAPVNDFDPALFLQVKQRQFKFFVQQYQPDIAIFHGHFYVKYIRVAYILRRLKVPYFIEPHGSFSRIAMQKSRIKKIIAHHVFFRSYIEHSAGFIFLNEGEKLKSVYKSNRNLIIPNGVKQILPTPRNINMPTRFYFIGRYDKYYKGLDILISALEILEQRAINLCIDFFLDDSRNLKKLVTKRVKHWYHVRISMHHAIHGKDKEQKLNGYGIMMLTSRSEGFPMTVLEALSYGNPCLVTPGTNMSDEIEKNHLGWGCRLDENEIAQTMINAMEQYPVQDYAFRCKKYIEKNYLWKNIAKNSVAQLKEVLDSVNGATNFSNENN